jgi:LytS/YehU family sensor histidine kinase
VITPLALSLGVVAGLGLAASLGFSASSPWTFVIVISCANVGLLFGRRLSSRSRAADASRQQRMIELVEQTLPHLRLGLTADAAEQTAQLLHDVMRLESVAITDKERVLAFVGRGSDHHHPGDAIESGITHRALEANDLMLSPTMEGECRASSNGCPLKSAVVAPLACRGYVVGSLNVYQGTEGVPSPGLVELTRGLAGMLSLQLEVALTGREAQMAETAKLDALRAQINPHFLFNTLNTIAMKARTDPEETRKLLVRLSDFLRYAMKHTGHFAPFSEEYFFVRTYLYLEKARFGDRLKIRYDVDPQCMSLPVPVLTIQPLIENAVKHGVGSKPEGGLVELRARLEPIGGVVRIRVSDNGVGMEPERLDSLLQMGKDEVGALSNINERLVGLYRGRASLDISSSLGQGTSVSLSLPVGSS